MKIIGTTIYDVDRLSILDEEGKIIISLADYNFEAPVNGSEITITIEIKEKINEETIPVTLATIKRKCGWVKFCEVTGSNEWMLNEHLVDDDEIFHVKVSHAEKLNL
jgi:hypothetical protein